LTVALVKHAWFLFLSVGWPSEEDTFATCKKASFLCLLYTNKVSVVATSLLS